MPLSNSVVGFAVPDPTGWLGGLSTPDGCWNSGAARSAWQTPTDGTPPAAGDRLSGGRGATFASCRCYGASNCSGAGSTVAGPRSKAWMADGKTGVPGPPHTPLQ